MRVFSKIIIVTLLLCVYLQAYAFDDRELKLPKINPETLTSTIRKKLHSVEEFKKLQAIATKNGVRVSLFGGTAAAFANYVRYDLIRSEKSYGILEDRFGYKLNQILRSTQDRDILLDGDATAIENFIHEAKAEPAFQFGKWEWKTLEGLKQDQDLFKQHTDTQSVSAISLDESLPEEQMVRDLVLKNPNKTSTASLLIQDTAAGEFHILWNSEHLNTQRFLIHKNPELFEVIRALTKAYQYGLKINPSDFEKMKDIIAKFDPRRDFQILDQWAQGWLHRNITKMISHSINVERTMNELTDLGLDKKIKLLPEANPLWVRKALEVHPKTNTNSEKTLSQVLGVSSIEKEVFVHTTRNLEVYESLVWDPFGRPNAFISRDGVKGENAFHGDGFYLLRGKVGVYHATGLDIQYEIDLNAVEDVDFKYVAEKTYLVVKNGSILKRVKTDISNLNPIVILEDFANRYRKIPKGLFDRLYPAMVEQISNGSKQFVEKFEADLMTIIHKYEHEEEFRWVSDEFAKWSDFLVKNGSGFKNQLVGAEDDFLHLLRLSAASTGHKLINLPPLKSNIYRPTESHYADSHLSMFIDRYIQYGGLENYRNTIERLSFEDLWRLASTFPSGDSFVRSDRNAEIMHHVYELVLKRKSELTPEFLKKIDAHFNTDLMHLRLALGPMPERYIENILAENYHGWSSLYPMRDRLTYIFNSKETSAFHSAYEITLALAEKGQMVELEQRSIFALLLVRYSKLIQDKVLLEKAHELVEKMFRRGMSSSGDNTFNFLSKTLAYPEFAKDWMMTQFIEKAKAGNSPNKLAAAFAEGFGLNPFYDKDTWQTWVLPLMDKDGFLPITAWGMKDERKKEFFRHLVRKHEKDIAPLIESGKIKKHKYAFTIYEAWHEFKDPSCSQLLKPH